MRVLPVPCLSDNYAYLVVCDATRTAALVDPSNLAGVEAPVRALLAEGYALREVWATHHHLDHVGGVDDVCDTFGVGVVVGLEADRARLPRLTLGLADGDTHALGGVKVRVMHVPGHTSGALAYVCESEGEAPAVFTGDTLFIAGCGRMFEGTPPQMHASLSRLGALPPETRVYCGHEYTVANLAFAAHLEPSSEAVSRAREEALAARGRGEPTVGGTIGRERLHNPFLRASSAELRATLGLPDGASDVDAFAAARKAKDTFVAR